MRLLLVIALMVAAASPVVCARTITGRITQITEISVTIKEKGRETTVTIDGRTRYTKWIKRKPWQEDVRLSVRALRVGRPVAIHLRGETTEAAWIQIDIDTR